MTSTLQNRPSWGDDDDSLPGSEISPNAPSVTSEKSGSGGSRGSRFRGGPKFRITYDKHTSTYASILYDVEGNVLRDEHNVPVNVFTVQMKTMLDTGDIICYHVPGRPGYRYFCTTKQQGELFRKARKYGHSSSDSPYHVYPDEPGCVLPYEGRCPTTALP
jgi:hypothetical protein